MIGREDLDLFALVDNADEVLDTIFGFYERADFEPSPEEQEIKLNP